MNRTLTKGEEMLIGFVFGVLLMFAISIVVAHMDNRTGAVECKSNHGHYSVTSTGYKCDLK